MFLSRTKNLGAGAALLAVLLLTSLAACRPSATPPAEFDEVEQIRLIQDHWSGQPLRVQPTAPACLFRDLAQAFCSAYTDYPPNVALLRHLSVPGAPLPDEHSYYVEEDTLLSFVRCDMGGQFEYLTALCHWPRARGHQLVAVLLQIGHEGECSDGLLLFYDYDPSTRLMRPDTLLFNDVQRLLRRHEGSLVFRLQPEKRAVRVWGVTWNETDDFLFDAFLLRWDGHTFTEEPLSDPDA